MVCDLRPNRVALMMPQKYSTKVKSYAIDTLLSEQLGKREADVIHGPELRRFDDPLPALFGLTISNMLPLPL